jgi:hypothetical protein
MGDDIANIKPILRLQTNTQTNITNEIINKAPASGLMMSIS